MERLTVLLVNSTGSYGEAEKSLLRMIGSFGQDRFRFLFASPKGEWAQRLFFHFYAHFPIPMRCGLDLQAARHLQRIVMLQKVDVVQVQHPHALLCAGVAARRAGGVAVILTDYTMPQRYVRPHPWRIRWFWKTARRLLTQHLAHHVIVPPSNTESYLAATGLPPDRVTVLPIPYPVHRPRPRPARPHQVIVTSAELTDRAGMHHVIDAAHLVLQKHPDAQFRLMGQGPLLGRLQQRIAGHGIQGNVRLLGAVPNVLARVPECDICVVPSMCEPFPELILEAMASSLPVVATAMDGPRDVVLDGETGIVVPPADPQAMADAILRLIDDRALARTLGNRGREHLSRVYSVESVAQQWDALYQDMARRRR